MRFSRESLAKMNRVRRLNLINGITGIKPANLIGTRSEKGSNLAIFSSIVHLGSDPALLGFILRPSDDGPRDTYRNILKTGYYTINHVHESFVENAHYTSAKFDYGSSEFELCGLHESYLNDFPAPYVAESRIKIGMKFCEEIPIVRNNTKMIIGEIHELHLPEDIIDDKGYVRLDKAFDVGIGGLNSYYSLKRISSFPFARVEELPDFNNEERNIAH